MRCVKAIYVSLAVSIDFTLRPILSTVITTTSVSVLTMLVKVVVTYSDNHSPNICFPIMCVPCELHPVIYTVT